MKELSIIIPFYCDVNYCDVKIKNLLWSIENQILVNFEEIEVIVINDNEFCDGLSSYGVIQEDYTFDLIHIQNNNNAGAGVSRQNGIDKSKSKFVMFCDSDDVLASPLILHKILNEIKLNSEIDILYTDWLAEIKTNDSNYMMLKQHEQTWMFGKVFNRKFLVYNDIRFHDTLRVHEDSYFNSIAYSLAKNINYLPEVSYIWRYNENSITRVDGCSYAYNSYHIFIDSVFLALKKVINNFSKKDVAQRILQILIYSYFQFKMNFWEDDKEGKYKKMSIDRIIENVNELSGYLNEITNEDIVVFYNQELKKITNEILFIDNGNIYDWLKQFNINVGGV